ncbi:hypothetical protein QBC36DRAFT_304616 [Triangularia setosa]|uniref:Uncharacterized protein n=1 Tax=Triangularia setosa TaxID=2587417 RepID=A0AAN6W121_9PEZI|nr:hypothetical protein QBC36DRAFT_304616 [Podospora setosa]
MGRGLYGIKRTSRQSRLAMLDADVRICATHPDGDATSISPSDISQSREYVCCHHTCGQASGVSIRLWLAQNRMDIPWSVDIRTSPFLHWLCGEYCHSFPVQPDQSFVFAHVRFPRLNKMHSKMLVLGALPMLAFARAHPPLLRGRTDGGYITTPVKTCEDIEQQTCGDGCVPLDYTCCPTEEGACAPGYNCQLGGNDEYGCCPQGQVCVGNGGAITTTFPAQLPTSTAPAYEEGPTSTDVVEEPLTTEPVEEDLPTVTTSDSFGPSATATQEPDTTAIEEPSVTATQELDTTVTPNLSATATQEPDATVTDEASVTTTQEPDTTGTPVPTGTGTLTSPPTSYTISTIYTTTTSTITSCPPTITAPCNPNAGEGSIVIITKKIAVSTTICPVTPLTATPTSGNTSKQPILPPVKPTYGCSQGVGSHCPARPTSLVNNTKTTTTTPPQPWGTAPGGYTGIFTGQLPTTTTAAGVSTTSQPLPVTAGAGKEVQGASWVGGAVAAFAVLGLVL